MTPSLSPREGPAPRRSLRGDILFGFGVAIALALAWLLRDVLGLLYVSAMAAVVLTPVVRAIAQVRVGRWRLGRGFAIVIIMVAVIGGIAGFLILTLPPLIRETKTFAQTFPGHSSAFIDKLQNLPFLHRLNVEAIEAKVKQDIAQHIVLVVSSIGNWAAKIFEIITGIVLTIYFLVEGENVYRWSLSLVPRDRRERLDETLQRAGIRMGRWLLGQLALMLILGVSSAIVFSAMSLPYAFALALLMGATNIIPVIGALVSTVIAMLVAASSSFGKVVGVLAFELVYSQIETAFLTPRIMKAQVDLAGTAVLIALLLGASLAGVAGALVAVPTAVLVAVLVDEYVIRPNGTNPDGADLDRS